LEFGYVGFFVEGGKPETQRKTLEAMREPTKTATHIWHLAGIEPASEASVLTTAPSMLRIVSSPALYCAISALYYYFSPNELPWYLQ